MSDTFNSPLSEVDPEIAEVLVQELGRQRGTLEMIASENFVPRAVLEAQGSVLTNKYAEGYPGRRYYGGCEFVDVAESLAISRAKSLFGSAYANVQPHSGANANMAVYLGLLQPGDTVLGLQLDQGLLGGDHRFAPAGANGRDHQIHHSAAGLVQIEARAEHCTLSGPAFRPKLCLVKQGTVAGIVGVMQIAR